MVRQWPTTTAKLWLPHPHQNNDPIVWNAEINVGLPAHLDISSWRCVHTFKLQTNQSTQKKNNHTSETNKYTWFHNGFSQKHRHNQHQDDQGHWLQLSPPVLDLPCWDGSWLVNIPSPISNVDRDKTQLQRCSPLVRLCSPMFSNTTLLFLLLPITKCYRWCLCPRQGPPSIAKPLVVTAQHAGLHKLCQSFFQAFAVLTCGAERVVTYC